MFHKRFLLLMATFTCLVVYRLFLMDLSPPHFSPSDNPASDHKSLSTRTLTFFFLPSFNFWLLLFPHQLSFDWSMDAIKLIESFYDVRNIFSLSFYIFLSFISLKTFFKVNNLPNKTSCNSNRTTSNGATPHLNGVIKKQHSPITQRYNPHHVIIFSLSLLIFPFLPACNLFFYVGFVVAERVLYIPSMGFCLFMGLALDVMMSSKMAEDGVSEKTCEKNGYNGAIFKEKVLKKLVP